ncbi:MAG: metallopeptidase family protein [Anaerolineae bacterium]|nr:metallopeptidase family protein [Anaerolineae bacterium]
MPLRISPDTFDELVVQALESLPDEIREKLDNVAIMVEDYPTRAQLRAGGVGRGMLLFGLYEGVPLTGRTSGYNMVMPDRITLFREPILMACRSLDEVRRTIAHTVLHEIAHHFGISDAQLREIGAY